MILFNAAHSTRIVMEMFQEIVRRSHHASHQLLQSIPEQIIVRRRKGKEKMTGRVHDVLSKPLSIAQTMVGTRAHHILPSSITAVH